MPDEDYAQLSLAMRTADDPGAVFDALLARDQIRIHASDAERVAALARHAAHAHQDGITTAVVADTNEQVAALNDAIRARTRRGRTGRRHPHHHRPHGRASAPATASSPAATTPTCEVANRDTWTVTGVNRDGSVTVTGERGERVLPADYVREHVELGYATHRARRAGRHRHRGAPGGGGAHQRRLGLRRHDPRPRRATPPT